jgi:hypothetical protein
MLLRDERTQVIDDLADHIGLTGKIGTFLTVVFVGTNRDEFRNLPTDLTNVSDQATWVVDTCLSSRWQFNPSLLELLLQRLVVQGGKGALQPILTRVQAGTDPNPDPFRSLWVLSDQPFLDRAPLRIAARRLIEDSAKPIFRVNGPAKSGKSYTTELLSYVMRECRPDLHVVPVLLAPGTAASYGVEELAESLTLSMEKAEPLPSRSTSSYPSALGRWVIRNANRNAGLWIFVLDGFGQPSLKSEVMELLQFLAQQIGIPEFARKLRLVLLHFDYPPFIGNWRAKTADDILSAGGITAIDLVNCLTEFNAKMQSIGATAKMINAAEIPNLAAALLARCSGNTASQLPQLYEELLTIANP